MSMTFKEFLSEVAVRKTDPDMDEYYADQDDADRGRREQEQQVADAPYAVGWSGQSHEWYGDDDMKRGRYKQKGDGGNIVAINVPSYEMAQKIEAELQQQYENGELPFVGGKWGEDHYIVDWHGTYIEPMKNVESWRFEYDKPKDYSK